MKHQAVFCESIGNPAGNIIDMEAISAMAHRHGVPVIVDNTVASPISADLRARCRYCCPFADQIYRGPRYQYWRYYYRQRQLYLEGQSPLPAV